jgi:hypothetical protein
LTKATAKDAEILLKLLDSFDTPESAAAMTWFQKDFSAKNYKEFKSKYPVGSQESNYLGRILGGFELAGVLVSHGILNEDLYFDMSGIQFVWDKIGKLIPDWQKEAGPELWENAVWLAQRQKQWRKEVWKPGLAWKQTPGKSGASRKG